MPSGVGSLSNLGSENRAPPRPQDCHRMGTHRDLLQEQDYGTARRELHLEGRQVDSHRRVSRRSSLLGPSIYEADEYLQTAAMVFG